jgi:hypothetical protein
VLDETGHPAVADRLDPSGSYRRALRAALMKALEDRARTASASCEREPVRTPHCGHGGRTTNDRAAR